MSLLFSKDPLTKREKQAAFKKSLDDQCRTNEEISRMSPIVDTRLDQDPISSSIGHRIPGLNSVPDMTRSMPGLDHPQHGAVYAPRFEGSTTPQEKQPYMSALSEMNGRPLHVRQQQFEKESQYRNLLRDQIEENRRRKEAEKARLEDEKRRELEEIQRLQGRPAPRRQQHAQFQESPDHPLPSPGRLPPTRYPDQRLNHASQGDDREGQGALAHAALPDYASRDLSEHGRLDSRGGWQTRERATEDNKLNHRALGDAGTPYSMSQTRGAVPLDGSACEGGRDARAYGRADAPSRHDGYAQGHSGDATGRPRCQQPMGQPAGEQDTATTLALEHGSRGGGARDDVVPRADFDELSNLCRDLLLEQKDLRRKLEEREERERLAERRHHQDHEKTQQQQKRQQQNGHPHRKPFRGVAGPKMTRTVSAGSDGRRHPPHLAAASPSRAQGDSLARESGFRRDSKAKSDVAFGSTVSRMGEPRKAEKSLGRTGSSQANRGGRHARVSKSEPVPRADALVRHHRTLVSTSDVGHGKLLANPGSSKPDWTKGAGGSRLLAGADSTVGEWTPQDEDKKASRSRWRSDVEGGGPIHGLLGSTNGRPRVSSRDTGASEVNFRAGHGELGGESTFLAAHTHDSGIREGVSQGRGGAFVDPRAAADSWNTRG